MTAEKENVPLTIAVAVVIICIWAWFGLQPTPYVPKQPEPTQLDRDRQALQEAARNIRDR